MTDHADHNSKEYLDSVMEAANALNKTLCQLDYECDCVPLSAVGTFVAFITSQFDHIEQAEEFRRTLNHAVDKGIVEGGLGAGPTLN
jgi:hypothetical protein